MEELMRKYGSPALEFDDLISGTVNALRTIEGKLVAFPMMTDVRILAYRKSYFENPDYKKKFKDAYGYELRPPTSHEELFHVAEFFKKNAGINGFADLWEKSYLEATFGDWLYSLGGRYFDEKWKPLYNSPEGVEALDLLKKSVSYGPANALELNHELADVAFFSEEVPMVLQRWSVKNFIKNSMKNFT
jgi:multiple sugar transport system substrate-binding protein